MVTLRSPLVDGMATVSERQAPRSTALSAVGTSRPAIAAGVAGGSA
jgi:hypothetical protein